MAQNPFKGRKSHAISGGIRSYQNKQLREMESGWERKFGRCHYALRPGYVPEPEGLAFYCRCGTVTYGAADIDPSKLACKNCGRTI